MVAVWGSNGRHPPGSGPGSLLCNGEALGSGPLLIPPTSFIHSDKLHLSCWQLHHVKEEAGAYTSWWIRATLEELMGVRSVDCRRNFRNTMKSFCLIFLGKSVWWQNAECCTTIAHLALISSFICSLVGCCCWCVCVTIKVVLKHR